ncbi:MAG: nitroreductase [Dactylosporangium sp.]|nr:nitroreductase [Dactylosporangium sp.]NNJ62422.1 nitroreductase [Dactylosporangium sp.]
MGAIQFTDRGTAVRARQETRVLAQAAVAALPAPSIFNSQPWRWRVSEHGAELRADRARQLRSVDPDGRLLTVSCGIALHHALTSLAAHGADADVERFPEPRDPDLLARIRVSGGCPPDPVAVRLNAVLSVRRTDRRPFADRPVDERALDRVRTAAEAHRAHLHLLPASDVVSLTTAASRATAIELNDPVCRAEIEAWTHRDGSTHDGIGTVLSGIDATRARPVPVRDFTGTNEPPAFTPSLADRTARYAVLFTDGDEPPDWLAAGEALSCVLLTATDEGLSASPMSETVEVPFTRCLLRRLLSGVGHPVVAIRFGIAADHTPAPATPRRPATDIIEMVGEDLP